MTDEAIKKLKNAICLIAGELDMDPEKVRKSIEKLGEDKLIEEFAELKDLRLNKENLRLVDLLMY